MACEKVITQKESGRSRRRLLQQYRGKKKTYFPSNLKCSHTKRVLKNSERAFYSWCALPRLRFITWIAQILVLLQVSFTSEQNCLRRVFFFQKYLSVLKTDFEISFPVAKIRANLVAKMSRQAQLILNHFFCSAGERSPLASRRVRKEVPVLILGNVLVARLWNRGQVIRTWSFLTEADPVYY